MLGRKERQDTGYERSHMMWRAMARSDSTPFTTLTVMEEIVDLQRRGFIDIAPGLSDGIPSTLWLLGPGNLLHDLLELQSVASAEIDELATLLDYQG
jgi:hypothetical protein